MPASPEKPTPPKAEAWPSLRLHLEGMSCASCANRIQKGLQATAGVQSAQVNFALAEASVAFDPRLTGPDGLEQAVVALGYKGQVLDTQDDEALQAAEAAWAEASRQEALALRWRLGLGAVFTLPLVWLSMGPGAPTLPHHAWWLIALAAPVQFLAGWPFLHQAWKAIQLKSPNMDLLVAMGSLAAFGFSVAQAWRHGGHGHSFAEASAVIITLVLLGKWLEQGAKAEAQEAVRLLGARLPATARRVKGDGEEEVPLKALRPGDRLQVRPGEQLPADGLLLEGHSHVDEAMLTGESQPVPKQAGSLLYGGTQNQEGPFLMAVTQVGKASTLAHIARLVREAQSGKSAAQALADRVSGAFVPFVLALSLATFLLWYFWANPGAWAPALEAAVAVLVVACPCALGLATPMAILVGTGVGAKHGVLLRGGEALEAAGKLSIVLFDKTGTLTLGQPKLLGLWPHGGKAWEHQAEDAPSTHSVPQAPSSAPGEEAQALLQAVASLEAQSEHPLAKAMRQAQSDWALPHLPVVEVTTIPGDGLEGQLAGQKLLVGTRRLLASEKIQLPAEALAQAEAWEKQGRSVVWAALGPRFLGLLALADALKSGAKEAVGELKKQGLKVAMLTGDRPAPAQAIAQAVGIEVVLAELKPQDKLNEIRRLQNESHHVAMVGDGVNDAPALAASDLGVALGTGADVALAASDLSLVSGDLRSVPAAIALARSTLNTIRGNLAWAFAYNLLALPLAATGQLSPMIAGGAMAFSSVFVVLNSLRLRGWRPPQTGL